MTGKGGDWVLSIRTGIRPVVCQMGLGGRGEWAGTIGIEFEEPVFLLLVGHDVSGIVLVWKIR